ncbi:MAG: hypothetical protein HY074_07200 [Deltaproteobacteria bacterium]|nr:hypothetical protein [Deltaproteobacteria bacterium]
MMTRSKVAIIAALLVAATTWLGYSLYLGEVETAALRARASKLFAYDHSHRNVLAAHRLRALSIAIEFRDDRGAEALLDQLESSI